MTTLERVELAVLRARDLFPFSPEYRVLDELGQQLLVLTKQEKADAKQRHD